MKKLIGILLIIILFPISIKATTLQEYMNSLDKYKREYEINQNKINSTDASIKNTINNINKINREVFSLLREKDQLRKDIEDNNKNIEQLRKNSGKIISYYQISNSNNIYLDYIFESNDITTFIYRYAIANQLLEYNKSTTDKLVDLIKKQEKRQKDIVKINERLTNKKKYLEKEIVRLGDMKNHLKVGQVSIKKEINNYNNLVNTYKKAGCKPSDRIGIDCAKYNDAGLFRRPMEKGFITGFVNDSGVYGYFHQGMDLSSSNPAEPIYAVANGKVIAVYSDRFGGKTVIVSHKKDGKDYTSIYIHMRSYGSKIYVGSNITSNDLIGYMGATGWATGPHLHLEVIPCKYFFDNNCKNWSIKDAYIRNLYSNGNKGASMYISFPNKRGVWWKGR